MNKLTTDGLYYVQTITPLYLKAGIKYVCGAYKQADDRHSNTFAQTFPAEISDVLGLITNGNVAAFLKPTVNNNVDTVTFGMFDYVVSVARDLTVSGVVRTDTVEASGFNNLVLKALGGVFVSVDGIFLSPVVISPFTQLNVTEVVNTTVETDLCGPSVSTGLGNLVIPADVLKTGTTIRLLLAGSCDNNGNGQDPTFRIYLGTNLINLLPVDMASVQPNQPWKLETNFVITDASATGSVSSNSFFTYLDNGTIKGYASEETNTYNGTIQNDMKITVQWLLANALNTIKCNMFTVAIQYTPP